MPMPNMATTLDGWEVPITLQIIKQNIIDGDLIATSKKINFKGVWQPLRMQDLIMKPEGQRDWSWYYLHTKTHLKLNTADKVYFQNVRYKVMSVKNWGLNGYYEYELVEDYSSST